MIRRPATAVCRVVNPQTGSVAVIIATLPETDFAVNTEAPAVAAVTDLQTGRLWLVHRPCVPGVDLEGVESGLPVDLLDSGRLWDEDKEPTDEPEWRPLP